MHVADRVRFDGLVRGGFLMTGQCWQCFGRLSPDRLRFCWKCAPRGELVRRPTAVTSFGDLIAAVVRMAIETGWTVQMPRVDSIDEGTAEGPDLILFKGGRVLARYLFLFEDLRSERGKLAHDVVETNDVGRLDIAIWHDQDWDAISDELAGETAVDL